MGIELLGNMKYDDTPGETRHRRKYELIDVVDGYDIEVNSSGKVYFIDKKTEIYQMIDIALESLLDEKSEISASEFNRKHNELCEFFIGQIGSCYYFDTIDEFMGPFMNFKGLYFDFLDMDF